MAVNFNFRAGNGCSSQNSCVSKFGCPEGVCPDFVIRRHDTKPSFQVSVEDCNGPLDVEGLVIEINMWAMAKLKTEIDESQTYFRLADDIGFEQIMIGDVIVMDRVRSPERMLVTGFDEKNKLVRVQRGYHGSAISLWPKGSTLRIFRIMNGPARYDMVYDDIERIDGSIEREVLQYSLLIYDWKPEDTCLPGCYWVEFKVLKMIDTVFYLPGGFWKGSVHVSADGFFYTGSSDSDAMVKLSYNQIEDRFYLPNLAWRQDFHLHTDDNYYTGASHTDGSVLLNKTGSTSHNENYYDDEGVYALNSASVIPSFSDDLSTPQDYGCILGEGVESVQRFPMTGEGFLIKIENTSTSEI